MPARVALVVTSAGHFDGSGHLTGLWFSELSRVYDECLRQGVTPVVVSIRGGRVPLEPRSRRGQSGQVRRRYHDQEFVDLLDSTDAISALDPGAVDGLYLAGGHGAMLDFPDCPALAAVVSAIAAADKPLGAVCHGPAGLLGAQAADGTPLVAGRRLTSFSWLEECVARSAGLVPFDLEEALLERGARFSRAPLPLGPHCVVDGSLVTGANPATARRAGRALVRQVGRRTGSA